MNDTPKTPGDTLSTIATGKSGLEGLQIAEHRPENLFRKHGISFLVRMGKIIAARRVSTTQRHQLSIVKP